MATERLEMRKIREALRLRHLGLSIREVARGVGASVGVVQKVCARAAAAGLSWADAEAMDEAALEVRLYGAPPKPGDDRPRPDPVEMHRELRRPGVTLELLHLEYLERHPSGLRYTAFCDTYRRWQATRGLVMRQVHKAGEKCFVDYSGKLPSYIDPSTGERVAVELFVAVLGASNFTYVEATATQQVPDFIASHARAYAYFAGVPQITVPDQLKSAVSRACRYEPGIQRSYAEMARHYGTAIVPARPYKPRDKAKVEVGVQIAQRWVLARLRNETFFSLVALNQRIAELREELNARPMKKLGGATRRSLYETYDRPALRPLPSEPYDVSEWSFQRVRPDYHVDFDDHLYSVPYTLVGTKVWVVATSTTVEVLHGGTRACGHARSRVRHGTTTLPEHMPEAHRRHAAGADDLVEWAASIGPSTEAMVRSLIAANPVREQGWRSARGLRRVAEKHGGARTELACTRALHFGARSYKSVENILALGREAVPLPGEESAEPPVLEHENVRGARYYH